jgi:hypothetical protein
VKEVYNPKAVIPHAASLHQACAHCAIFPTAASRRSLGRVSVPVWPITLSGRLPVVALVGHYPTNKLIGRGPIPHRKSFPPTTMRQLVISGIRPGFPGLSQSAGQITHVLLTRSPLEYPASWAFPFDLHVLSTPPAFVLSQDQTLHEKMQKPNQPESRRFNTKSSTRKAKPDQNNPQKKLASKNKLISVTRHQSRGRIIQANHLTPKYGIKQSTNTLSSSQRTHTHQTSSM